jgi:pimeloyl-ACP methyl ester carboxylesterase
MSIDARSIQSVGFESILRNTEDTMVKRSRGFANIAGAVAWIGLAGMGHAVAGSLGGPLNLQDEGSFFVNGRTVTIPAPYYGTTGLSGPGQMTVGQMYVHFRIPAAITGAPVVMVHGSNHTGMTYETTPDGREGWATYFVRHGHPVYVVDHVGRGRSGFNPTPLNDAVAQSNVALVRAAPLYAREGAWVNFRFGPAFPKTFPGLQFPIEAQDQYFSQLVPNAEGLAGGPTGTATIDALAALLDRIGPAVVVVHSQSGVYGLELVRERPQLVRAFVSVEGGCAPVAPEVIKSSFAAVPMLSLWGDNSTGAIGINGDARRNGCKDTIDAINGVGGRGTFYLLPEHGLKGNSHMMMLDKNNLAIADVILGWVDGVAKQASAK